MPFESFSEFEQRQRRHSSTLQCGMPELTRSRYPEIHDCWHVYYGDVHVGTIALRSGAPVDVDQWGWILGFYPGTEPEEYRDGTAKTFDVARANFDWGTFSALA
jgi:hypothetical protein